MPEMLGAGEAEPPSLRGWPGMDLNWHEAHISPGLGLGSPLKVLEAFSPSGPNNLAEQAGWAKPYCVKVETFLDTE